MQIPNPEIEKIDDNEEQQPVVTHQKELKSVLSKSFEQMERFPLKREKCAVKEFGEFI